MKPNWIYWSISILTVFRHRCDRCWNLQTSAKRSDRYLAGECHWYICRQVSPLIYSPLLTKLPFEKGHPVPHTHLKDEKPLTEGPRKGLLSPFPRTEPQERWLSGAWPTDRNGVAQFTSKLFWLLSEIVIPIHIYAAIYPGYYSGRATHIHAKVFTEWEVPASSPSPPNHHSTVHPSFHASRLSHVGQFFFSEDLNDVIDKMYPYITNPTRGRTLNLQDSLNIFNESHGPEGQYNPVFKTHLIGGVIRQGVVGFITMVWWVFFLEVEEADYSTGCQRECIV